MVSGYWCWVALACGSSHHHHDEAPAVVASAVAAFLRQISFAKLAKAQASVVF